MAQEIEIRGDVADVITVERDQARRELWMDVFKVTFHETANRKKMGDEQHVVATVNIAVVAAQAAVKGFDAEFGQAVYGGSETDE